MNRMRRIDAVCQAQCLIDPQPRQDCQFEGVHPEGETDGCGEQQCNDREGQWAHQYTAQGKAGDHCHIGERGNETTIW